MEPREAIEILIKMQNKYSFNSKEKQAVIAAMGVLDSAAFTKNRIKGIIAKQKNKLNRFSKLRH